jgi:hypothetical protein
MGFKWTNAKSKIRGFHRLALRRKQAFALADRYASEVVALKDFLMRNRRATSAALLDDFVQIVGNSDVYRPWSDRMSQFVVAYSSVYFHPLSLPQKARGGT